MSPAPSESKAREILRDGNSYYQNGFEAVLSAANKRLFEWSQNQGSVAASYYATSYDINYSGLFSFPESHIAPGLTFKRVDLKEFPPTTSRGIDSLSMPRLGNQGERGLLEYVFGISLQYENSIATIASTDDPNLVIKFGLYRENEAELQDREIIGALMLLPPVVWTMVQSEGLVILGRDFRRKTTIGALAIPDENGIMRRIGSYPDMNKKLNEMTNGSVPNKPVVVDVN